MAAKSKAKQFQDLLFRYSQAEEPGKRKKIEARLWTKFGAEHAIFVLDMFGFSLLTRKHGIVHYLSMVKRMQLITEPIIESFGGSLIKYEADNCFAVFPTPLPAVNAAVAMQLAFEAANLMTSDDLDIRIACGIDYGRILVVGQEDCFGDPVNRACKLGEDLAAAGEILVTKTALDMIPPEAGIRASEMNLSISGMSIPAFKIEYRRE